MNELSFDNFVMWVFYYVSPGEEVALYCSKYLPDIIKEQKAYKDGKLQKVRLAAPLIVLLCYYDWYQFVPAIIL